MKRTIIILLFLIISIKAYSQWGINWGILGVGLSGTKLPDGGYVYIQALDFSYQTNSGLGFAASPLDVYHYFYGKENNTITFVNISSYFDFVKDESLLFGPFAKIRTVDYNKLDFLEFRAGIKFSINLSEIFDSGNETGRLVFKNFSLMIEAGYNYNNKIQHGYYAHIGMDIISALFLIGIGTGTSGENPQDKRSF
ncbi:MAG: hypothetical protein LBF78_15150 [Treponema sp.]|jgi:hypothetical protein|nr:hypothetical protein [Treponema sp.]